MCRPSTRCSADVGTRAVAAAPDGPDVSTRRPGLDRPCSPPPPPSTRPGPPRPTAPRRAASGRPAVARRRRVGQTCRRGRRADGRADRAVAASPVEPRRPGRRGGARCGPAAPPPTPRRRSPPPPMRRAARIERRFVWAMALLAGVALGRLVGAPDRRRPPRRAAALRLRRGGHPGRRPGPPLDVARAGRRRRRARTRAASGWCRRSLALAVALASTVFDRRKYLGAVVALFAVPALLRADTVRLHRRCRRCACGPRSLPVLVSGYRVASRRSPRAHAAGGDGACSSWPSAARCCSRWPCCCRGATCAAGPSGPRAGSSRCAAGRVPQAAVELSDAADSLGSAHDTLVGLVGRAGPPGAAGRPAGRGHDGAHRRGPGHRLDRLDRGVEGRLPPAALRGRPGRRRAAAGAAAAAGRHLRRPSTPAADRFADVSSPGWWGRWPISWPQVSDEVDRIAPQAELAVAGAAVAPGMLGGDGTRHYFVAFTTEAEARGPRRLHGQLGRAHRRRTASSR